MKKFTTTFFLLMAMVLLLPTEMRAHNVYLHSDVNATESNAYYSWSNHSEYKFKYEGNNVYTFTLDASDITKDIYFRIGVEGWSNDMCPYGENDESTTNATFTLGTSYEVKYGTSLFYGNKRCFIIEQSKQKYSSYKFTVTIPDNGSRYIKVEGVTSGSGGEGEDDDLTGFVPGATSNGNAYYLASKDGNLFNQTLVKPSENTIKYNRILRFNDSGKGTYTVDIPATVTGDLYIEEVDKDNNVVAYYPTSSNKTISASVPANNAEVVGKLVTDLNYWAMTDRSGQNDGLYTITLTLGEDGKPGKWSFKHDAARRVAYFFSTAENSSAYPVYSDITSNKFIGYNYFDPTGVAKYYVISNITMNTYETIIKAKQLDPTLVTLSDGSPTVNKLMIMGNRG